MPLWPLSLHSMHLVVVLFSSSDLPHPPHFICKLIVLRGCHGCSLHLDTYKQSEFWHSVNILVLEMVEKFWSGWYTNYPCSMLLHISNAIPKALLSNFFFVIFVVDVWSFFLHIEWLIAELKMPRCVCKFFHYCKSVT